jgi:hypothetical protein
MRLWLQLKPFFRHWLMRSLTACTHTHTHTKYSSLIVSELLAACCCSLTTKNTESDLKYTNKIYKICDVHVVFQPLETLYFFYVDEEIRWILCRHTWQWVSDRVISLYPTDNTKMLSLISWWSKAHNLDNLHPALNPYQPTHQLHATKPFLRNNVPCLVK